MTDEQQLGITARKQNDMSEWYTQVVRKAGLADYAPVKGCMVIEPRGMSIWEALRDRFDDWISDEVDNAYFPLFIPESYLEREKDIVEGFDPEVAWVENAGGEELEERLAIRPTSESIIAPFMSKWIRSYRDLPMRLNQWANVVRWEATDTRPFLRTREFLWQEGHTAHADHESAQEEMHKRLDQYRRLYEEVMAIPTLTGRKPEHDKFPGANVTTTVEALMPDGKSIQGGTSHDLGTDFAEAFDITFEDADQQEQVCHTTSWGLSTRAIGALIMAHGDDDGLVLPPEIAPEEVVIVPIFTGDGDEAVQDHAETVEEELGGFRVELDDDEHRSPGFKYNHWELRGVPLRVEVGPDEAEEDTATLVRRDTGDKQTVALSALERTVEDALEEIQVGLYEELQQYQQDHIADAGSLNDVLATIGKQRGYVRAPWCGEEDCEEAVKDQVHAEIVLVPFEDEDPIAGGGTPPGGALEVETDECAVCGDAAERTAYFAKNY